jgi:hypothetical protein
MPLKKAALFLKNQQASPKKAALFLSLPLQDFRATPILWAAA